jgi:hypothetical protein
MDVLLRQSFAWLRARALRKAARLAIRLLDEVVQDAW